MPSSSMGQVLPVGQPGSHREEASRSVPWGSQVPFSFDARTRLSQTHAELRQMFAEAVRRAGGVAALVHALDRRPSYDSKVVEAMNGSGERSIQLDWLAPLLDDPNAAEVIAEYVNRRCGFEPPVRRRQLSQEEIDRAAREVAAEMKDEDMREAFRTRMAKKLGVRPEDVAL